MTKELSTTTELEKLTSEAVIEDKQLLTENQLDALEWARDFMKRYEKRKR